MGGGKGGDEHGTVGQNRNHNIVFCGMTFKRSGKKRTVQEEATFSFFLIEVVCEM
jgi:hypothetical protein